MNQLQMGGGGGGTGVHINGRELSVADVDGLETAYGVKPAPGDYWYDSRSGVFGISGQGGLGFMLPDHELGPLTRDCSAGQTGVIVNGRELPQLEWMVWSQVIGSAIQPGLYWLDANGNAGVEGSATPVVNFVEAAGAAAAVGGGDNFWSSRFGAGNYDQGGQRGYVSVPGHGPIGYGF